jgi:hypothetical protein
MNALSRLFASVLCTALVAAVAPAQEPGKPPEKPAPAAKPATAPAPVFVIAKVHGKHEILAKEALEAKNKALAEEYAKALSAYEKEKKAAEAANKKFEGKAPVKNVIEMVGGEYPSREAAEAALKKLEAPKEKPAEKPAEKPGTTPKK